MSKTHRPVGLSIQRSNQDDKDISIQIRLDMGRTITTTMTPHDFALFITGMTDVPATMRTRNVDLIISPRAQPKAKK